MQALLAASSTGVSDSAENISFPATFAFGTATSAYQIEGGWQEGGRGLSIWDAFAHAPGKVKTGETGDVAADHYHRWRSDVQLMAQMRLRYYRFSISWSRVLPNGYGAVNEEGVRFYSMLIDELIAHGIHPVVTLYHWDLPLVLQVEHDGWLSEATASAFVQYAAFCFARFGDRVKHWITLNEPAVHAVYGHARGEHAPGRRSRPNREPYVAGHHMLLAHAYTVARYRKEFATKQAGLISIALNSDWREPASESAADVLAAQRSIEFNLGWFADPLYTGDYPPSMRSRLGARLPTFTSEQRRHIANSTDFFALQHYASMLVSARPESEPLPEGSFYADEAARYHSLPGARKNVLGWDVAPFGIYRLVKWVQRRYRPTGGIVITENGFPLREESAEEARYDLERICYLKQYLVQLARAMQEGVVVRGYFVWTLLDNFEWAEGTAARFGLLHVDFATQRRSAKGSAAFFARLSETHSFRYHAAECNATVPVNAAFSQEAMQLQLIINRTAELRAQSGRSTSASVRSAIMARASRLVTLADMQARHTAANGLFRATRSWLAKAAKMRTFVERQRLLLERILAGGAEGGGGEGGGVEGGGAPSQSPSQDAAAADKAFGEPSTAAAEPLRRAAQDLEDEVSQIENELAGSLAGGGEIGGGEIGVGEAEMAVAPVIREDEELPGVVPAEEDATREFGRLQTAVIEVL